MGDSNYLFAPRPTHAEIKKSYAGVPESWYDNWVFPTLADLYMETEAPHTDYEREAFLNGGWLS
jgi:hypothetical protein